MLSIPTALANSAGDAERVMCRRNVIRILRKPSLPSLIAAALTIFGLPLSAQALEDRSWTVESHAGTVSVHRSGVQPIALNPTQSLDAGSTIETGADGRVVLVRGDETIIISPSTSIALPEKNDSGMATTILQSFGTILLQVEKRASQHFEVETPFLAAVVKGTRFTVTVNQAGAAVHVVEGAVEVLDLDTGDIGMVRPGQTAHTPAAQGVGLSLGGPGAVPPIRAAAPARPNKPVPAPTERRADNRPATPSAPIVLASVGPARLDVNTTTNGLARAATVSNGRISAPDANANTNTTPNGNASGHNVSSRTSGGNDTGLTVGQSLATAPGLANNPNSNAGGNGNGLATGQSSTAPQRLANNENSNAGGNGNGNSGGIGLTVGQSGSTPPGLANNPNANAGGNGNENGGTPPGLANNPNANAGGNSNGNSGTPPGLANNPNANAGGNGNENGGTPPGLANNPNANAGGNSNGNSGAPPGLANNPNANAGGNGNENGGTPPGLANNPNANAGGNGNGNSGTPPGLANNPNANAGGNGNENGGGNGNSNAGGNGKGNGKA
jgi:FecR protein